MEQQQVSRLWRCCGCGNWRDDERVLHVLKEAPLSYVVVSEEQSIDLHDANMKSLEVGFIAPLSFLVDGYGSEL